MSGGWDSASDWMNSQSDDRVREKEDHGKSNAMEMRKKSAHSHFSSLLTVKFISSLSPTLALNYSTNNHQLGRDYFCDATGFSFLSLHLIQLHINFCLLFPTLSLFSIHTVMVLLVVTFVTFFTST